MSNTKRMLNNVLAALAAGARVFSTFAGLGGPLCSRAKRSETWCIGGLVFGLPASVLCVFAAGCGGGGATDLPLERGSVHSALAAQSELSFEHDFGVVRPRTEHKHCFSVENRSGITWTLKGIHVNCACTVVDASSTSIAPGAAGEFDVAYRAGRESRDEVRAVLVEFNEPQAPIVRLVVEASIRVPMTVSHSRVKFDGVSQNGTVKQSVAVKNFSSDKWPDLSLRSSAPWLSAEAQIVTDDGDGRDTPRQEWRCNVVANTQRLSAGKHEASMEIDCTLPNIEPTEIPVELTVTAPVVSIPAKMFFGTVRQGHVSKGHTALVFADASSHINPESVSIAQDVGPALRVDLSCRSDTVWDLNAILTASAEGFVEGTISVRFPAGVLGDVDIPVVARVRK